MTIDGVFNQVDENQDDNSINDVSADYNDGDDDDDGNIVQVQRA